MSEPFVIVTCRRRWWCPLVLSLGKRETGTGKMPENRGKITQTWMCACAMIRLGDEKNALHWFTKGGNDPGSLRELGARLLYASGML